MYNNHSKTTGKFILPNIYFINNIYNIYNLKFNMIVKSYIEKY